MSKWIGKLFFLGIWILMRKSDSDALKKVTVLLQKNDSVARNLCVG